MAEAAVPAQPVPITPLRDHLQPHWRAMVQRLGARWPAFESTVRSQAAAYGIADEAALARYAGLCLTFGPGFEQRPEHEWALALLADERLDPWVKLHQAVLRAVQTLKRRGGDAQALVDADRALVDQLADENGPAPADSPRLPRRACDLEALDLRLLLTEARQEYEPVDGAWQRRPAPPSVALRVDAQRPMPPRLCVLAPVADAGAPATLQLRQIAHGGCPGDHHPSVTWLDARGEQRWQGHEARAVSWPVQAPPQSTGAQGFGTALVAETWPAVQMLRSGTCGLRDEGVPLGPQQTQVWTYPADQWLFALQRRPLWRGEWPEAATSAPTSTPAAPAAPAAPPGSAAAVSTRVRLERDGRPVSAPGWSQAFDDGLPRALTEGFSRLFDAWRAATQHGRVQAEASLFGGQGAMGWGWREGLGGLADAPLMRIVADLQLTHALQLTLLGEIELAGSRSRLRLSAEARAEHVQTVRRESSTPPVLETLLPVTVSWRSPFVLELDPVAVEPVLVCSQATLCSGALVGEAGLRPRPQGSGWQWFVRLSIEPVMLTLLLHDPFLGQQRRQIALLPATTLLDWSAG